MTGKATSTTAPDPPPAAPKPRSTTLRRAKTVISVLSKPPGTWGVDNLPRLSHHVIPRRTGMAPTRSPQSTTHSDTGRAPAPPRARVRSLLSLPPLSAGASTGSRTRPRLSAEDHVTGTATVKEPIRTPAPSVNLIAPPALPTAPPARPVTEPPRRSPAHHTHNPPLSKLKRSPRGARPKGDSPLRMHPPFGAALLAAPDHFGCASEDPCARPVLPRLDVDAAQRYGEAARAQAPTPPGFPPRDGAYADAFQAWCEEKEDEAREEVVRRWKAVRRGVTVESAMRGVGEGGWVWDA